MYRLTCLFKLYVHGVSLVADLAKNGICMLKKQICKGDFCASAMLLAL